MRRMGVVVIMATLTLGACGGDGGGSQDSDVDTVTDLEREYLLEIEAIAPGYFASFDAALLYVENYCDTDPALREPQDEIDEVVESYCDTALAE